ncbi:MAG: NAD(P)H-hydrate dehydratase [Tissierellia bacterium]|nr:NAD(P)H-hydrate dehydratase [Tissierellia bacterium]
MIGIDIVSMKKFENKIENNPSFLKVFTDKEIEYAKKKNDYISTLSGIFAAKEAVVKSLGLKLYNIKNKDIEIFHENSKPYAIFKNNIYLDISISHEKEYAIAISYDKFDNYDIGIDDSMKILPYRKKNTHKGDYGKVLLIGGSSGMAGSIYMSSKAALRSGCGLCYILAPKSIASILQIKSTEAIVYTVDSENFKYDEKIVKDIIEKINGKDSIAIGPGMGKGENLSYLIEEILRKTDVPIVIDADGINAVAKNKKILRISNKIILTPHEMEFSRLSGLSIDYVRNNRLKASVDFAKEYGVYLVLKGNKTIITDGYNVFINNSGTPAMATAGSGDVLTGIIASMVARFDILTALRISCYAHGKAGELASYKISEESVIASDIIDNLGYIFKKMKE